MATYGLHFAGLDAMQVTALLNRLSVRALELGFIQRRGPGAKKRGNLAELLRAVDNDEIRLSRAEQPISTDL